MNSESFPYYLRIALISYLFGSIPFGYLLVKLFRKQDIRATGSGNIGATNVARSGAKWLAILTLIMDALKGALPVWIYLSYERKIFSTYDFYQFPMNYVPPCLAALFAVLGHMFPVWLKFKGGKGVATAMGVFAVLAPKAILISLGIFLLIFAVTRYVSFGSVASSLLFPFSAFWFYEPLRTWPSMVLVSVISLLIIVKHHANIRRLINGTEPRFGSSMPASDDNGGEP